MRENENPSGRTEVSLREYVETLFRVNERRIAALKDEVNIRFDSVEKASIQQTILLREIYDAHDQRIRELLSSRLENLSEIQRSWVNGWEKQWDAFQESLSDKLSGMNELRSQITGERGSYITREFFDAGEKAMDSRLAELDRKINDNTSKLFNKASNWEGRGTGVAWIAGAAATLLGLIFGAVTLMLKFH